ncbi:MAG: hypothetical protein K6A43_03785 [Treponema sp.]|nr:hypothetical protein [Treponema sp.]
MKKIVKLIAITAILAGITSCASKKSVEDVENVKAPETSNTSEPLLIDDFEYGLFWEAVGSSWNDGDCSMFCKESTEWGTEGETSLECTVTTNGADWEKSGFFTTPIDTDWTGLTKVIFDIYNPNNFDLSTTIVLQAGENWDAWNQLDAQIVPPGESTLEFDISNCKNIDFIQRLIVYQFGAVTQECKFYIDNVRAE